MHNLRESLQYTPEELEEQKKQFEVFKSLDFMGGNYIVKDENMSQSSEGEKNQKDFLDNLQKLSQSIDNSLSQNFRLPIITKQEQILYTIEDSSDDLEE